MRLAVLSDIHGNLTALETALADLESVGEVDMLWVLGDLAAFGTRPAECVQRIREMQAARGKEKMKVIGGNADRYLAYGERPRGRTAEDAEQLPGYIQAVKALDTSLNWSLEQLTWDDYAFLKEIIGRETALHAEGYGHVIGYHAVPGDDESQALSQHSTDEEAADALLDRQGRLGIGGHIHRQYVRDLGRWQAVNVGSVGLSFDMPGKAQWGLFTFQDGDVTIDLRAVPYDLDAAINDTNGHPMPERIAARLREGR